MNIFISCALFYPSKLGGPANTLYWLSKGLVAKGHKVYVVTTHDHIEDKTVPINRFTIIEGINVFYASNRVQLLWESFRIMKKCDTIILSSVCYSPELFLACVGRLKRKRVIWSPRGEFAESAIGGRKSKLAFFKLIRMAVGKYVLFHATSQDEEKCIRNILGCNGKTTIIPNYMEIPRQQKRQTVKTPYLLFLGRIAPIKAIENLIEGASMSKRFREGGMELKIAGGVEGQFEPYYQMLKDMVRENRLQDKVKFVGPVSGEQKLQTYCDAHFLFLVSKSENFGNVVIESLSQGTPVVASLGTPWKGLEEVQAGFWIDNSPSVIANTIDKILALSPDQYKGYRDAAICYSDTFNIYTNIKEWERILK